MFHRHARRVETLLHLHLPVHACMFLGLLSTGSGLALELEDECCTRIIIRTR